MTFSEHESFYGVFALFSTLNHVLSDILTHLPRVPHICISGSGNGSGNSLSPVGHQAITRTNADLLSIAHLRTHLSEILIEIPVLSFKETCFKMLTVK